MKMRDCFHGVSYSPPYVMPPAGRQWKRMCVSAGCIDMDSPACLCIFPLLEFTINRVNKTKKTYLKRYMSLSSSFQGPNNRAWLHIHAQKCRGHTHAVLQGGDAGSNKRLCRRRQKKDTGTTFFGGGIIWERPLPFWGSNGPLCFPSILFYLCPPQGEQKRGCVSRNTVREQMRPRAGRELPVRVTEKLTESGIISLQMNKVYFEKQILEI